MFQLTHPLPKKYWIAVSGGIDSMAVLNWLHLGKPSRKDSLLGVVHVNHMTGMFADEASGLVNDWTRWMGVKRKWFLIEDKLPSGKSKEEWWREQRYKFFHSLSEPVILAHTFDDCLEEYIMCTMVRGYAGTIPYRNGNCIRPFRKWKREDIENYMKYHDYPWKEDPSNRDTNYKRNYIRHEIVPRIKKINPGIYNIVEKVMENQDKFNG